MTTLFTIHLTINMPNDDRRTRQLLNFYFVDMPADVNEIAYHMCGDDAAVQARKFAKLTRKRADVWSSEKGGLEIFALLSVLGEDSTFIQQVFAKYMEGFSGCLERASGRYFSPSGFPPGISLEPGDWKAEIHKEQHTEK